MSVPAGPTQIPLAPLHYLYCAANNDHFYTASQAEYQYDLQYATGYADKGIQCYVYPDGTHGGVPLYRASNTSTGLHLFTTDPAEYNALASPWNHDGIACYVLKAATVAIPGSSFETPCVGASTPADYSNAPSDYQYGPAGGPWAFWAGSNWGAGIAGPGSAWGNPPAPQGAQVAFVQFNGALSQSLPGFQAGVGYTLNLLAAQCSLNGGSAKSVQVQIDGGAGTVTPSGTAYGLYSVGPFTATAGTHTLSVAGLGPTSVNNAAFLDDLQLFGRVPAPDSPGSLTATQGRAPLQLSWTSVAGASGYNVYRSTGGGSVTQLTTGPITATSYQDGSAVSGGSYFYAVTAIGPGGESAYSNIVSASVTPSAPTGLQAASEPGAVSLTWNAAAGASRYNVYRSTVSESYSQPLGSASGTSYTDATTAGSGTTYDYVVTAVNAGGESGHSNEASAAPGAGGPAPAAPQLTGVLQPPTGGGGSENQGVGLFWNAVPYASSYTLTRTSGPPNAVTTTFPGITTTAFTDSSLNGSPTGESYSVVAVGPGGQSGPSNTVSLGSDAVTAQNIPTLSAHAGTTGVGLSWTFFSGVSYALYRRNNANPGGFDTRIVVHGTSYSDGGLTPGATYTYVVTTLSGDGEEGPGSNAVTVTLASLVMTGIQVSPATAAVSTGGTHPFTATAVGPGNVPLPTQPAFTWSVDAGGVGTVNGSGLYAAGPAPGQALVRATSGLFSGFASVYVTTGPTVTASASPNPVTGTSTQLTAAATGGTAPLAYAWGSSTTTGVSLSGANTASPVATFTQAGSYTFTVLITDASGATAAASVPVTVRQTPTVTVTPATAAVAVGGTQQFTAAVTDQFGAALASPPAVVWSVSGGGSIDGSGLFTAGGAAGGPFTVTAALADGSASGAASVTVSGSSVPALVSLTLNPTGVTGGSPSTGTVTLSAPAPAGGLTVSLSSGNAAATVPSSVTVAAGATSATFTIGTGGVATATSVVISASYGGVTQTATLIVNPATTSTTTGIDLTAVSTGSGKITLYWTQVPGATGYNVYRALAAGGENYTQPVNGGTPVNSPSYGGSSMDMFTDTGLTNGTEYFYTVEAVGSSQPSNEDSDVPDPNAVPWDTRNPSAILSAFRGAFSNVESSTISPLRVVGPDNTVYDDAYATAQPPDGAYDANANQVTLQDGTVVTLPDDEYSSQGTFAVSPRAPYQYNLLQPDMGPYRRVLSVPGRLAIRGDITLPLSGNVMISPPPPGQSSRETACIYLGMHDAPDHQEVDAGLVFSSSQNNWVPFMGISKRGAAPQQGAPLPSLPVGFNFNLTNNNTITRFSAGATLTLTYYAYSLDPSQPFSSTATPLKINLLVADGTIYGDASDYQALGGVSHLQPQNLPNVQMKRTLAIAQKRGGQPGVTNTGSNLTDAFWNNGQLAGSNLSFFPWSVPNTQPGSDGYFDGTGNVTGKQAAVTWDSFPGNPYFREDNTTISIVLP